MSSGDVIIMPEFSCAPSLDFFFQGILGFVGIDSSRLQFSWISASEGKKFVDIVNEVTNVIKEKGPFEICEDQQEFVIVLMN